VAALAWWPYAATRVHDAVYGFARTSPFGGKVDLERGPHTFWIEGDCMSCRGNEPPEYRAVASVTVGPLDGSGGPLELRPAPDTWVYNTGAKEGRALYLLDVPKAGSYGVRFGLDTSSPSWDNRPPAAIAIGEGTGLPVGIVRPMVYSAVGSIVIALGICGVTFERRRRFYERRYPASSR